MAPYIVWDWNGTLFDDRVLLFDSMALALRDEGFAPVAAERMVVEFTRPMQAFFERLVRRQLNPHEWSRLDRAFRRIYQRRLTQGLLAPGTREVLAEWRESGGRQSLLSLWRHDDLAKIIRRHRLTALFDEVIGRRDEDKTKGQMLLELLDRHQFHPDEVVLIGDTHDDVKAANEAGVRVVLVVGASLERIDMRDHVSRGVPVAESLRQALTLAPPLTSPRSPIEVEEPTPATAVLPSPSNTRGLVLESRN